MPCSGFLFYVVFGTLLVPTLHPLLMVFFFWLDFVLGYRWYDAMTSYMLFKLLNSTGPKGWIPSTFYYRYSATFIFDVNH